MGVFVASMPKWSESRPLLGGDDDAERQAFLADVTSAVDVAKRVGATRMTVVTGERGAFVADTLTADLTFYANGEVQTTWDDIANFRGVSEGDVVRYAIAKPEPLRVEHEQFRDAVLGKDADIVTMTQGLQTVRVAEACIESARTGQTVTL